eukprot:IDg7037t1
MRLYTMQITAERRESGMTRLGRYSAACAQETRGGTGRRPLSRVRSVLPAALSSSAPPSKPRPRRLTDVLKGAQGKRAREARCPCSERAVCTFSVHVFCVCNTRRASERIQGSIHRRRTQGAAALRRKERTRAYQKAAARPRSARIATSCASQHGVDVGIAYLLSAAAASSHIPFSPHLTHTHSIMAALFAPFNRTQRTLRAQCAVCS